MFDAAKVQELVRQWDDGWNTRDVAKIMAPFAKDVVFNSPFVSRLTDDSSRTTIEGFEALQEYVETGLGASQGVRYTVDAIFWSTDTFVFVYTIHLPDGTDRTGADFMRVGGDGTVTEWRSHYPWEPAEIEHVIGA